MTSALNTRLWHFWSLILDDKRNLAHEDIRRKIIRLTIPATGTYRILEIEERNCSRLEEAVLYNPFVKATALLHKSTELMSPEKIVVVEQIERRTEKLTQYRAAPEFDLILLFEWLARLPVEKRQSTLQYCKMLLKPGATLVTAATTEPSGSILQDKEIKTVLWSAGFCKIDSRRLTKTLRLVTAQRPVSRRQSVRM